MTSPAGSRPAMPVIASTPATASQQLAEFCVSMSWDDLPPTVRRRASELTLDLLGVAIRGSMEPSTFPVRAVVEGYRTDDGASGIGVSYPLVPSAAALLNGTAAHAIEMDDVTRESSLHPGVAVIPAALALAEHLNTNGRALLEAIVVGYEVSIRVGNALNPASAYARGFHPTGVAGAFGAAAASARLLGCDEVKMAQALGIAGTMASGSLEYLSDGSWTKRLNAGWAAHSGVVAAQLAAAGYTGPATALEGRFGALHAYSGDPRPELLTAGLGMSYQISSVAIKPYGCCRYNHGLIDGALEIRARHEIHPSDVGRIRLGVLSGGAPLVAIPIEKKRRPANPVEAQFSAPFAVAVAIVRGAAGPKEFEQEAVDDNRIRALMAVTDCYSSPELDEEYPQKWPAAVEVTMKDGRTYRSRVEFALGEPENPLSTQALLARFSGFVADRLPHDVTRVLQKAVIGLEFEPSVRVIAEAVRSVRTT